MVTKHQHVSQEDAGFVLSTLEHDQLALAKKTPVPRRRLRGDELVLLWALRLYLIFMFAVVCWQSWLAVR